MPDACVSLEKLEQLFHEESSEKRRQLLTAVTYVFFVTLDHQSTEDGEMFGDLMERIAYELEIEARAQLSEKLSKVDKVPRRLMLRLANDEIAVARPILERSPVLEDGDLIDVIRNRSQGHMDSIARRNSLSEDVSGELVERGDDTVMASLAGNHGADLSEDSFAKMATRARDNSEVLQSLGARSDVPPDIMAMIKSKVADRMKSELAGSHSNVEENLVGALVERCAEDIDLDYCQESIAEIDRLHQKDAITEEMITRLPREIRLPDLVHCLGLVTGLDNWSVSQCLLKAELSALAILCKSNRFSNSTFLALAEMRIRARRCSPAPWRRPCGTTTPSHQRRRNASCGSLRFA
jgi:uncharacterized protein (DUF2336 family)